ncbi:LysE/ArgO family amino acid transporter [Isoptericola sp. b441]|uniref:LysE/ArgO family amino acid transporter n=1 Tax=Actinotalea lenta TaxID=3064654 RepID=A0ABT9D4R8_9CELL|nr:MULTISPECIES: LysE/ArgO family amino acid transporter [unclassified Isoptericola]MDO8105695.1 LysE/ArgO family amino acid transporter [Isoptericola sp. b441]MDO8122400.1 LysE/ArgO family amino acid transporter [Isoptericola sp. b490]
MPTLATLVAGLLTGLSLIVVIGAQNAFVLRQGLRREHVGVVVAVCTASDAVLIGAGVAGLGAVVRAAPVALTVARWGGAAFLTVLAVAALRRAAGREQLTPSADGPVRLRSVLATTLALTWLNPHVYLDTVVLLGGLSTQHDPRWAFAAGAATGSLVWFTLLGFGARRLAPLFARPTAWRLLDLGVAAVMVTVALRLVLSG